MRIFGSAVVSYTVTIKTEIHPIMGHHVQTFCQTVGGFDAIGL
jgi:hypothetical protein